MSGHASGREGGTGPDRRRTHYESAPDEQPSEAVVAALSSVTGVDGSAEAWLYERVDPDALDAIFAPTLDGQQREDGQVRFGVGDYDVVVESDGDVVVTRTRCE